MKRLLFAAALAATTVPALASDVTVSVSIGQPGSYGRIDIGGYPQPQLIYRQPRVMYQAAVQRRPIYLHGDKDGDGVLDEVDACIDVPGVASADPKTNGCPGDTDGDGFRDDQDACPQEKGVDDPDPSKRGCPKLVRVTDKEIIILEQVQFDTGKSTIKKVSDPLLDSVAQVLKEHPEILKLEVQGHTDNKGAKNLNTKLSQDRATSVQKALEKRGIDPARMVAKGYGPDVPIATNDTVRWVLAVPESSGMKNPKDLE